ncbi:MAG: maleylacetoacetate isomerase [Xanthomonadales bacterium]|jgi:maleylacetoacetate isomerase|nr:maleylacetoacetate isomerase [Xanthomonadales bacterium]
MADALQLYDYWRSSSAYRVRIALNLKGLSYRQIPVHLVRDGGQQNRQDYRELNPLGLVPVLVHGEHVIVQSMAICEYLEERFEAVPLLPRDAEGRARVRGLVQTVCAEIQPLNNLSVMQYLKGEMGLDSARYGAWYAHWIARGFRAVETWLSSDDSGDFCHGNQPGLADCYLVPQVYNAERFKCDMEPYPRIREVVARCRALEAFSRAAPEAQPDAE